jgi:hypothetical protein
MTFTDIAELKIRILGQDAVKTFDALNASAKDVKDQLKEMELMGKKNTEEYKELARVQRDIQQEIKKTTQGIDIQNASMRELEALMRRKNQELKNLKIGSAEWIAKLKEIEPIRDRIAEVNQQVRGLDNTTKSQEAGWTKYAGLVKAAFVVGVIIEFAKQVFSVGMEVFNLTAKFEKYETVLKNALGSQDKATAALKMLKDIAATTPFSLDEMTASFNKMVNRGLLPTSGEMKKLSDLAASQGKSFDQLTEAVLDAQMGEAERLKEFGIKMKKEGDNVSLSFKGQTTNVKNNEKAIYEAIVAMGEYNGVAGVTSEVSDKLAGKQSNLGDKIEGVVVQLGEKLKPAFHFVLNLFEKGVLLVQEFIEKSAPLGYVFDAIAETFTGLWNIGKEIFFKLFPYAKDQVFDMGKAVKVLGTVLYAVLIPFQLLRAVVVGLIDAYRVLGNATSMVGKALKGDFEGAKAEAKQLETSWNNLKKNGTDNFGAISKGFNKIWTDSSADIKNTGKDWDKHVDELKKGQKAVTNTTAEETKKREKINEEARKKDLDRFNELYDQLQVIYKEHEKEMAEFEENRRKERVDRDKKMADAIKEIEKNITQAKKQEQTAAANHQTDLSNGLKNRITQYYKDIDQLRQQNLKAEEAAANRAKEIEQASLNIAYEFASQIFSMYNESLSRQLAAATTATEKAVIENKQAWSEIGQSAVGVLTDLASGNLVGAIIGGVKTLFSALDQWVSASHDLQMAKLADLKVALKQAGDEFMQFASGFLQDADVEKLSKIYDSLIKITEIPPVRIDLGVNDSYERRLKQELEIGAAITKNYGIAVEKENQYADQRKKGIEEAYALDVKRINDKYDLMAAKANVQFSAESLAIQTATNADLLRFITNEESKLSLTNEYEGRRNFIINQYADQIRDITPEMSQAEIDGINAATKARDEALAKVEAWRQSEIQSILSNEGQKRTIYSETDQIIKDGKEALENLSIKFAAADLKRESDRKTELAAANKNFNAELESEAKRHNDELTRLGLEKDAALKESFKNLNDIVNKGYDDMIAKALEAYNAGKITADQYNEIANRLFNIKNMLGQIDWSKLTVPNFDWDFNIPRFASGTEYLDPNGIYPSGTDKVPIMADRGERIIDKYSNAQLGGISNRELVNMVTRSNLYRNGPNVSTTAGMVNLASPASVQQASHITNNISTTALEAAVAQMAQELKAQSNYLATIADKDPSINFHALSNAFKESAAITARSSF